MFRKNPDRMKTVPSVPVTNGTIWKKSATSDGFFHIEDKEQHARQWAKHIKFEPGETRPNQTKPNKLNNI